MCECANFLVHPWQVLWEYVYAGWCRACLHIEPAEHVKLLNAACSGSPCSEIPSFSSEVTEMRRRASTSSSYGLNVSLPVGRYGMHAMATEHGEITEPNGILKQRKTERPNLSCASQKMSSGYNSSGANGSVSLFTKRGRKGVNQDAMLLIEDFASRADTVFCGVFDGHGPHGHYVAKNVGDALPQMLASCWHRVSEILRSTSSLSEEDVVGSVLKESIQDEGMIGAWKDSLVKAYKLMDRELLLNNRVDCVSSGTTAVTLVKQGDDLILGNVGDSRAILGSMSEDGSLVAIQLTVDLKPDVPREAERIMGLKGRVFALQNEPSVMRVWLPHLNAPGLAMTRALGDYCLKKHGVISEPVVYHRRLTDKDKFIVLATDGVWDVLSNEQVVKTVALAPVRSSAGKAVVDAAVNAWESNYMTSKVDDCAVICLFFDNLSTTP